LKRALPLLLLLLPALAAACASTAERDALAPRQRLYHLPWEAWSSHRCIQAGPGFFSHEGREVYAVDFAMPVGTPVLAAREGRVVLVKEDSDRGGSSKEYGPDGNRVIVLHGDATRAVYMHLRKDGAEVQVGEFVLRGTLIGYSGDTGYSTTSHLHFAVEARDPGTGSWTTIPFAFIELSGDGIPRLLGSYESENVPPGP
jgi:murein DD-endopeptidase MepM/ murein hydrolase activator NlpD